MSARREGAAIQPLTPAPTAASEISRDVGRTRVGVGIDPHRPPTPVAAGNPHGVRPARVEMRIDQLVLEGIRPADASLVAAALQRELARLASQGGLPAAWVDGASLTRVDGGSLQTTRGAPPEALGVQIAQALHRGLMGGSER